MTMVNAETIVTLITAFGGFEFIKWAVNRFVFRKQETVKADSSAMKTAVEAEKAVRDMYEETITELRTEYTSRLEELRNSNKELNEYNLALLKAGSKKDEIIDEKTIKIRELNESCVNYEKRVGELQREVVHYKCWFCQREYGRGKEECIRRKPAQNPPLKYSDYETITETGS